MENVIMNFTIRLYQALTESRQESNIVVSPFSVPLLLALVRHGAGGVTEKEITEAVKLPPDRAATAEAFAAFLDSIQMPKEITFVAANTLIVERSISLKQTFRLGTMPSYKVECQELDFANNTDSARCAINAWLEEISGQQFKEHFKRGAFSGTTRMLLLSSVFLKASWWRAFDSENTKPQLFTVSRTKQVEVPTMCGTFQLKYGQIATGSVKVLQIYYDPPDAEISMIILLPNTSDGLQSLESNLGELDIMNISLQVREVEVSLPKTIIKSTLYLKEILTKFGISEVFEPCAELEDVAEIELYLNDVIQATALGIYEKGTDTTVPAGQYVHYASAQQTKMEFKADHPFLFLVRDKNTLLFIGSVTNPQC